MTQSQISRRYAQNLAASIDRMKTQTVDRIEKLRTPKVTQYVAQPNVNQFRELCDMQRQIQKLGQMSPDGHGGWLSWGQSFDIIQRLTGFSTEPPIISANPYFVRDFLQEMHNTLEKVNAASTVQS